jgi:hypothetical protein
MGLDKLFSSGNETRSPSDPGLGDDATVCMPGDLGYSPDIGPML